MKYPGIVLSELFFQVELLELKDTRMSRNILPMKQVRVRQIPTSIMICIRVGI